MVFPAKNSENRNSGKNRKSHMPGLIMFFWIKYIFKKFFFLTDRRELFSNFKYAKIAGISSASPPGIYQETRSSQWTPAALECPSRTG